MSEEQTPTPTRPAGVRNNRGGTAGARPAGARTQGARPAGARTQGARPQGTPGQGEGSQRAPDAKLKKFSPVYIVKAEQTEQSCTLCRNDLTEVCNICRTQGITDPLQCPPMTGKCGHIFHYHCIKGWLEAGHTNCPYPGCEARWENFK